MRNNQATIAKILHAEKIVRSYRAIEKANTPKAKEQPARKITYGKAAVTTSTPEQQNAINAKFWATRT